MFLVPNQPVIVGISCALFGFFGVGAYPIGLELAVEATYPVEESISTAFIFMSGEPLGDVLGPEVFGSGSECFGSVDDGTSFFSTVCYPSKSFFSVSYLSHKASQMCQRRKR